VTRTWFTADLHFGELEGREFDSAEEMAEVIIDKHNAKVKSTDVVWVLGDVAVGQIRDTLPLLKRLKGRKYLVAGERDRCFAGAQHDAKLRARWVSAYREQGDFLGVVTGSGRLSATRTPTPLLLPRVGGELAGVRVQLSHFPYAAKTRDPADPFAASRPKPWRPAPSQPYPWLLHGHVGDEWCINGDMINVGTDAWGLEPVDDEIIRELIEGGPQ
jgi:calcineurin-like phosphoesterase family protein